MNKFCIKAGRLFRDNNRAIISGVCAGIARQFGVDPLWLRAAAVVGVIIAPLACMAGYGLAVVLLPKAA